MIFDFFYFFGGGLPRVYTVLRPYMYMNMVYIQLPSLFSRLNLTIYISVKSNAIIGYSVHVNDDKNSTRKTLFLKMGIFFSIFVRSQSKT